MLHTTPQHQSYRKKAFRLRIQVFFHIMFYCWIDNNQTIPWIIAVFESFIFDLPILDRILTNNSLQSIYCMDSLIKNIDWCPIISFDVWKISIHIIHVQQHDIICVISTWALSWSISYVHSREYKSTNSLALHNLFISFI